MSEPIPRGPLQQQLGGRRPRESTARNPQRTTHNAQRITHNPQPATHNPQPETRDPKPATHNAQRTTHNAVYLDHAATTPLRREVLEAMFPYFQQTFGNPSSVHGAGHVAAGALVQARSDVAAALGCAPDEIIFTSGGTEADNLAVIGAAEARRQHGDHVIVSAIEHEAVLQSARELLRRGFHVSYVPVDSTGMLDPESVAEQVTPRTVVVSCMYANNEIGTIQPISEITAAIRTVNPDIVVHTDAVQAAGSLSLDVEALGVDLLSLSAHKIYGPRGVGVLYVRGGIELHPLIHGGGQESGRRSGTENVAGCIGLATALSLAQAERLDESRRLTPLRDRLIDGVLATTGMASISGRSANAMANMDGEARLTGHPSNRLPAHASFVFPNRSGESILVDLDVRNIMCSSGSACHAGMTDPSHVLLALGLPPTEARNGLRMTLGRDTDEQDITRVLAAMSEVLAPAA